MHVLVVDDDPGFRRFATLALEGAGMDVTLAEDAEQAVALMGDQVSLDIILLDVLLPGASGRDLLLEIRSKGDEIPVVFASASDSVTDRVQGLRMGADDYIVKPIEHDELAARIEAVHRRRRSLPSLGFGDLSLDLAYRRASRAGTAVDLTPREYDLLLKLVEAKGETVTREELLRELWDLEADSDSNVLDVHVGRLRRKLGNPDIVETVRGRGYRLIDRGTAR